MKTALSCMVSVSGFELTDNEKYLLNRYKPLGVTLFSRNINTPSQVKKLISEIKEVVDLEDTLVGIDQEGGRVVRLKAPFFRSYLSQRSIGALSDVELQKKAALLQAELISADLKGLGFNLNYAPCADVLSRETGSVLKTRCFSSDEKKVMELSGLMSNVYHKNGIVPCLKHVPGHGRASLDPHLQLPKLDYPIKELQKDFFPFKKLADKVFMMMTAHIVLKELDDKPVTVSNKIIQDIIRKEIGFKGFLITDAIDMKALRGTLTQKINDSLNAGCDAVCFCMGDEIGLREVLENTPVLSDAALDRLKQMKNILKADTKNKSIQEMVQDYEKIKLLAPVFQEDYDAVETLNQLIKQD